MVVRYPCNFTYAFTINDNRGLLCAQNRHSPSRGARTGNTRSQAELFVFRFSQGYIIPLQVQQIQIPAQHDTTTTPHIQYVFCVHTNQETKGWEEVPCARIWNDDGKKKDRKEKRFEGVEGSGTVDKLKRTAGS